MGILVLNNYGQLFPRRRLIEGGLVALGILLALLAGAGPITRALQRAETATGLGSLADFTSLLAIVVLIALLAGIAYAFVAIPSQTQLQEDIPEEARGRVFGILNMLVSVASFRRSSSWGRLRTCSGTPRSCSCVAIAILALGHLLDHPAGPAASRRRRRRRRRARRSRRAWTRCPSRCRPTSRWGTAGPAAGPARPLPRQPTSRVTWRRPTPLPRPPTRRPSAAAATAAAENGDDDPVINPS